MDERRAAAGRPGGPQVREGLQEHRGGDREQDGAPRAHVLRQLQEEVQPGQRAEGLREGQRAAAGRECRREGGGGGGEGGRGRERCDLPVADAEC